MTADEGSIEHATGARAIKVVVCNGDMVDEANVEFLNIEEDIQGADVLTFRCPVCGEPHKSRRYG
jgi:hypothetical protein